MRDRLLAQLFAGLSMLFAPAFLRIGSMLDIPVFEVLIWTAASYLVIRIIKRSERRLWPLVGAIAGVGLLTKHTMLLWGAGLLVGLLLTKERRQLTSGWLWLGAVIALLLFAPNLVWQAQNDWATLEFLSNMRNGVLADIPRPLFLAGQALYMHPLSLPVWITGLVWLFRSDGGSRRFLGWMFVTMMFALLVTRGKPYYLAPAYPVLFAAGGVALGQFFTGVRFRALRNAYVAAVVTGGIALSLLVLPALPVERIDGGIDAVLGWAVPPMALTHDLHAEFGWVEHTEAVLRAYETLSADDRERVAIVVASYGQASALNHYGRDYGLPRAVTGHQTFYLWGPPPERGEVLITYGLSLDWLGANFESVEEVDRIEAPLARPFDADLPIFLCRTPTRTLSEMWPDLKRYANTGSHPTLRNWSHLLEHE